MGSGKTLIAEHLSRNLQLPLIDLDNQISLIEEHTIADIFQTKGELYFRRLETRVLEDVLEEPISLVFALGGGTPCYGANLDLIKSHPEAKMIYLKGSVEFLTDRLFKEKDKRPVINHLESKEDLDDFVRKHLFERGYYYHQSDLTIDIEGKKPETIVDEIVELLK